MESVPEFMECLKCVRRMDMLIRIIAIVQSGVMLTKKVKFMETPKQPKNSN